MIEFSIRTEQALRILFFLHTLLLTLAFKLLYALYYQYNAEISTFSVKKCLVLLLPTTLMSKRLAETDVKKDIMMSKRHPDVMHNGCKMTFPCTGQPHGNLCRVCKNIRIFNGYEVLIENSVTSII